MLRIVRAAQFDRPDNAAQVAFYQRDAGALNRDVGAGAHGDADVRRGQGRRVVDAVARPSRHASPVALQLLDVRRCLSSGPTPASTSSIAKLVRHRSGRPFVVAGEHDDPDTQACRPGSPSASTA